MTQADAYNSKSDAGDIFTCWPVVEIKSGKLPYFECRDCGQACVEIILVFDNKDELVKCPACNEYKIYHYTPAEKWV